MIPRYSHPLVSELYSDEWTYGAWLEIEQQTLYQQRKWGTVPGPTTDGIAAWLGRVYMNDTTSGEIRAIERTETHHDVAAFLLYLRRARANEDGKWIHYGLTSSDLVDTAQAMRFKRLYMALNELLRDLVGSIASWTEEDQPMLGRTHGQPAEPTSIRVRAVHWVATIEEAMRALRWHTRAMCTMKLSGPVGTFAHNPPEVEAAVADLLGLIPRGAGASQVVPRTSLALWASSAATLVHGLAKIGTDLRLLNMTGEVSWEREPGHVGSSAMPHKNNPIEAEQLSGLARLAAGYAAMLQPLDLWLERDISNSGPERVAVPDLWHVLFHAISKTVAVMETLELQPFIIEMHLMNDANAAWSHKETLAAIQDGETYEDARTMGREVQVESYDVVGDARWFTKQYPTS